MKLIGLGSKPRSQGALAKRIKIQVKTEWHGCNGLWEQGLVNPFGKTVPRN